MPLLDKTYVVMNIVYCEVVLNQTEPGWSYCLFVVRSSEKCLLSGIVWCDKVNVENSLESTKL